MLSYSGNRPNMRPVAAVDGMDVDRESTEPELPTTSRRAIAKNSTASVLGKVPDAFENLLQSKELF